jgi:hypothetical protein
LEILKENNSIPIKIKTIIELPDDILNINKILEVLNFIRLWYPDKTVNGVFPTNTLNCNIIKNNYIYDTTYYNNTNLLPNYTIFTEYDYYLTSGLVDANIHTSITSITGDINTLVTNITDTYFVNYVNYTYPITTVNIYTPTGLSTFNTNIIKLQTDLATLNTYISTTLIPLPEYYTHLFAYTTNLINQFKTQCIELSQFSVCLQYITNFLNLTTDPYLKCTNISDFYDQIVSIVTVIWNLNTPPANFPTLIPSSNFTYTIPPDNLPSMVQPGPPYVYAHYVDVLNAAQSITNIETTTLPVIIKEYTNLAPTAQQIINNVLYKSKYNNTIYLINTTLNNPINATNPLSLISLGYQGETINTFDDYNYLIADNTAVFNSLSATTNYTTNNTNVLIELEGYFNDIKEAIIIEYNKLTCIKTNVLIKNALNYGYINNKYMFVNLNNINN